MARLYRALFRQRHRLSAWYPRVAIPDLRFGFAYGGIIGPLPAGALVRLWSRWPEFRGRCAECRGSVLGISGGGAMSAALLTGVCRRCSLLLSRPLGGFGAIVGGLRRALDGSGFGLHSTVSPARERNYGPLLAVLRELGEDDLPAGAADGLHSGREQGRSADPHGP